MAIHMMTGFEGCDDATECLAILNAYTYYSQYGGFYGGNGYGYNGSRGIRLSHTFSSYTDRGIRILCLLPTTLVGKTVAVGSHYYTQHTGYNTNYYGAGAIFAFHGPDIRIYNDGNRFIIHRGTTYIAQSPEGTGFGVDQWHHVEVLLFSDASAGAVTIKLDGVEVYAGTGLNTGGADITGVRLSSAYYVNIYAQYDNIYFADELQGILNMVLKRPNGDYDASDFTCSSGTDRYALIDEDYDGDASYIESSTVGHKAVFDYEDYTGSGDIVAVQVNTVAKVTDAGSRTIQHLYVQNSTEYLGSGDLDSSADEGFELTSAYPGQGVTEPPYFEVLNTQPDGTAWNTADFNALKIGVEVTA